MKARMDDRDVVILKQEELIMQRDAAVTDLRQKLAA
jgi:hypothetical protein